MTNEETDFEIGKAYEMLRSEKPQVALVGCGPLLHEVLLAAKQLEEEGIGVVVLSSHTVKPLDEASIIALARECGAVVSIEEHQAIGGLGGAIAELLAKQAPTKMGFIGVQDVFGQSGTPIELIKEYHLDKDSIVTAVRDVLKR